LFIGCGPGIEIELVKGKTQSLTAYDLDIDPFLSHAHPSVDFCNTFFDGSGDARYDTIYLIEILEHLSDPLALLESCKKVLAPNGRLHLTTATNLPQFDHRYNFEPSHETRFKEDIEHAYMTTDIEARNRYYVLGSSGSCAD
jgi:2-polyprenyl-3-methyl-5-hydroxy-6-metoxy-1,4-benzoquinol methylase